MTNENLIKRLKTYELYLDGLIKSAKEDKKDMEKNIRNEKIRASSEYIKVIPIPEDIVRVGDLKLTASIGYLSKLEFYEEARNKLYELFPELKK